MRRYKDNPYLIITNIILEYALIVATYILCGIIRVNIPRSIAMGFAYSTITYYLPFIMIVALLMVGLFIAMGDYFSIHFRNKRRIIFEAFMISFMTGAFGAFFLFILNGSMFSRLLLIMLVGAWTVAISVKRIGVELFTNAVMADKIAISRILIIGGGENASRYYERLIGDKSGKYEFVGYLAENESSHMGMYLGKYDAMYDIVSTQKVDKVVIADESPERNTLSEILSICGMFGIEAEIIPIYADYISENQKVHVDRNMKILTLNTNTTSNILGVNIAVTDMDKTISDIRTNLNKWRGKYICVSNVHTTIMAHDDEKYRRVQNEAVLSLPDGGPLSSYSRSEGKKDAKRVTGPDLMREMLIKSGENGWSHFFYGSTQKTLDMLKEKIENVYPGAKIAGMISPPYRELTPEEDAEYIEKINSTNPDFVWVGLGAPKQEIWMSAHKDRINALMIGVGAAFDYESGNLKRAPKWMQKCNLEWLYRFMQEPRRLFKRYFVTNIKFLWLTRR